MAQKESAEQKLLKIIEATKKAQAAASGDASVVVAPKKSAARFIPSIQQINIILIVCVIASLIFLGNEIQTGMSLVQTPVQVTSSGASGSKDASAVTVPQVKGASYYFDKMAARNIFQPFEKKAVEEAVSAKPALEKRMEKYKIVGIAWLDVPESATVMIEDTATRTTRFLKEGDKVEDITVKTIYTDRVIFRHANEEITKKL